MPEIYPWNWERNDWPAFRYDRSRLEPLEADFLQRAGVFSGALRHVDAAESRELTVELIRDEALNTSEIEGQLLDRDSVQSSIMNQFGIAGDGRRVAPAETGIARMMVDLHREFGAVMTHELLCRWQGWLMSGRTDLDGIGRYRTSPGPMRIVSGRIDAPTVHFEAPPADRVPDEMCRFLSWFNATRPGADSPLPILARAGMAHLHLVSVHPFEDGSGRVARALAERALSEGLGHPALIALSQVINEGRRAYYEMLEDNNREMEITAWLVYFGETVLAAQHRSQQTLDFVIAKTKFYDRLRGRLNARQEKVLARMMREGPRGFRGGLSAKNYIAITGTSRATATRDLQDLVEKGALARSGELKSTRYRLRLELES